MIRPGVSPLPRILVVDDNQLDAQLLREAFADAGFAPAVVWAPTGPLGVEFLRRMPLGEPLLVVLDLNMPGVSGQEILREMRAHERFREVPVLVFTTSGLDSDRAECERLGVRGFLRKPATYADYRGVVETIRGLVQPEPVAAPLIGDEG